jgi:hypothetical protein
MEPDVDVGASDLPGATVAGSASGVTRARTEGATPVVFSGAVACASGVIRARLEGAVERRGSASRVVGAGAEGRRTTGLSNQAMWAKSAPSTMSPTR